ncbi:MAG TPA: helix-turn-helix domain-containing protein [Polyangia bacterium]|nr:helix-turn-helix domain-containing protein [Polyangia bacterium]
MLERALERAVARQLAPIYARLDELAAAAPPALVDVEVAAERLGLSVATVRRQAAAGVLPARRVGRSWRIDLAALRPVKPEQIEQLAREARSR